LPADLASQWQGTELTRSLSCAQLVSHDFRLIDQVAQEIWVCDKKKITIWKV